MSKVGKIWKHQRKQGDHIRCQSRFSTPRSCGGGCGQNKRKDSVQNKLISKYLGRCFLIWCGEPSSQETLSPVCEIIMSLPRTVEWRRFQNDGFLSISRDVQYFFPVFVIDSKCAGNVYYVITSNKSRSKDDLILPHQFKGKYKSPYEGSNGEYSFDNEQQPKKKDLQERK